MTTTEKLITALARLRKVLRTPVRYPHIVVWAAVVSIAILIASSIYSSMANMRNLEVHKAALVESQEMQMQTQALLGAVSDMQLSCRAYKVTADQRMLKLYETSKKCATDVLNTLTPLSAGNPSLYRDIAETQVLLSAVDADRDDLASLDRTVDSINQHIRSLEEEQERSGAQDVMNVETAAEQVGSAVNSLVMVVIVSACLLLLLGLSYLKESQRAHQLSLRNAQLERDVAHIVFQDAPVGIVRLSPDLYIKDANAAFYRFISEHPEQVVGLTLTTLFPCLGPLFEVVRRGEICQQDEYQVDMPSKPDWEQQFWNISAWPITDELQEIVEIVLVITDVTDRIRLANEREDLYATLSHDLRVPLLGANRVLELMIDGKFSQSEVPYVLKTLSESNAKVLKDVTTLVELSKYTDHNFSRPIQHFNLCELIPEVLADFQYLSSKSNQTISLEFEQPNVSFCANRDGIYRLLSNLVDNAVKFTPEKGQIKVSVGQAGKSVTITVSDNGPGMDPETQSRLFRRFWRGLPGRYQASVGFGLYLCRRITEFHDGTLDCLSKPGEGTTFVVTLPITCDASCRRPEPVAL